MRRQYWWIITIDTESGRPMLIAGGEDENKAREKGLEMLAGLNFELKRYPTRDRNEASAYYRGKRLESGIGLHKAAQRIGHEKSLARLRRRRSK